MYRVAIITLSDTASKGERIDESGRVIAEIVRNEGYEVVFQKIIPDEGAMLETLLCGLADNNEAGISINRFSAYGRLPTNSYRLQTIDRMFVFKRPDAFFNQPDVF